LEGVDPLICKALGDGYGPFETTSWAGTFVAQVMKELGYKQERKRSLKGCIAKFGASFKAP